MMALETDDPTYACIAVLHDGRPPRDIDAYCVLVIRGENGTPLYGLYHYVDEARVRELVKGGQVIEVLFGCQDFYLAFPQFAPPVRAA